MCEFLQWLFDRDLYKDRAIERAKKWIPKMKTNDLINALYYREKDLKDGFAEIIGEELAKRVSKVRLPND